MLRFENQDVEFKQVWELPYMHIKHIVDRYVWK